MDLVIAMIFYAVSFVMYKINRKIINPLFIMPFLWANMLLLYSLLPHALYPLQNQFFIAIFLWVFSFVFGGFLINFSLEKLPDFKDKCLNVNVFNVYYLIVIVFTPLCVYLLVVEAMKLDIQYLFVMLRSLNTGSTEMETSLGFLGYIFSFAYASLLLKVQNYDSTKKGEKLKLNVLVLMNILLSIVTMARTSFLFLAISVFVLLVLNGKLKAKHYFVSIGSFVALMVFLSFIRSMVSWEGEDSTPLVTTISTYLLGGMPAFDTVSIDQFGQFGSNVFRFFYAVLNALGCNFVVNPTIYDYVNIPVLTNVYTVMYPFFRDFGFYGVSFFGFVYGFVFQLFFKLALKKSKVTQLIYAYIFPMLLMQFFGEYLFSNLSTFLQMLIFFSVPYFFKIKI